MSQWILAVWSLVPLAFLSTACTSGSSWFTYCRSLAWRILSIIKVKRYLPVTGNFNLGLQNEAGQKLTGFFQENVLVIANTLFQQHKRWLYAWLYTDGQYWNQIDYILCSQRIRPGADCGSDHQLPISKFRLKLKQVGKTTRPFRYDINQIPYDYKVEITNRFKGLEW